MKNKFFKTLYFIFLSASIIIMAGCVKGPQGPQGPEGNANVTSQTFNVSSGDWGLSYSYINGTYYYTLSVALNASNVTSEIASSGVVEVFMLSSGSGNWLTLPWIYRDAGPTEIYNFSYHTGVVNILDYVSDGTEPVAAGGTFKVVAIASSAVVKNTKINWGDYNEIKRTFNLKD